MLQIWGQARSLVEQLVLLGGARQDGDELVGSQKSWSLEVLEVRGFTMFPHLSRLWILGAVMFKFSDFRLSMARQYRGVHRILDLFVGPTSALGHLDLVESSSTCVENFA